VYKSKRGQNSAVAKKSRPYCLHQKANKCEPSLLLIGITFNIASTSGNAFQILALQIAAKW